MNRTKPVKKESVIQYDCLNHHQDDPGARCDLVFLVCTVSYGTSLYIGLAINVSGKVLVSNLEYRPQTWLVRDIQYLEGDEISSQAPCSLLL